VGSTIFATAPATGESANLMYGPESQSAAIDAYPQALAPVPGGWGERRAR
jgi:hypothetical protein